MARNYWEYYDFFIMQRLMIQNITLVLCLESINMWIDMDNKTIEKIQNLLELAYDAPNDEEGQTALLIAQRLMVKHNLSMNDLTNSKTQKDIGETIGTWEYRLLWWQEKLAGILGENFRCKTIRRRHHTDNFLRISI